MCLSLAEPGRVRLEKVVSRRVLLAYNTIVTAACPFNLNTILIVSEPNPLRPLRDLQYGLGETVFGGCRHIEYMNI